MKNLRKEGFKIGRYRVRQLMKKMNLVVKQRKAYKVTTKRKHSDIVSPNLVNQCFSPTQPDDVWAGDITYLRTSEGWLYLAIVMDLFSRRIIGWKISKQMTSELVIGALQQAWTLKRPKNRLIFHSDRGSQYTSHAFRKVIKYHHIEQSMGDVGACWDNAVVERFFGSLKHDWLLKVSQPTHDHMKQDVASYMRYYNMDRLHTFNDDQSPIDYEKCFYQAA